MTQEQQLLNRLFILVGGQGTGKTHFAETMVRPAHKDAGIFDDFDGSELTKCQILDSLRTKQLTVVISQKCNLPDLIRELDLTGALHACTWRIMDFDLLENDSEL